MVEVFKHEESGYGSIVSREFVGWRTRAAANEEDIEAAKARLLDSIKTAPSC